ncbi:MAG TPA: sigma-70 family RNA polymerase sigma factor, partial [Gemmatimonadales bacterium]
MASAQEPPASAAGDERELVERVRGGDTEAFGELVRRYERRAHAIAWRLLGVREDAEDLVQDAFIAALDKLDSFDERRPFGPWFFRILVNRGTSRIRSRRVRAGEPLPESLGDPAVLPDRAVEQQELAGRVHAALAELSDRQRL